MNTRAYTQDATYWGSPVSNGLGGFTYAAPVALKVRWEERQEEIITHGGEVKTSRAIVWVKQDLDTEGFLYLGTSTASDPATVHGAFKIQEFRKIPSIRGTSFERRAFL